MQPKRTEFMTALALLAASGCFESSTEAQLSAAAPLASAQSGDLCGATAPVLEGEQGQPGVPCSGCVTNVSLAPGAVDAEAIADGAVGPTHLGADAYAGSGGILGSASTVARADHAHAEATPAAAGLMSAADKAKLDAFSGPGTLNCVEELDLVEQGTSLVSYWPDAAARAELFLYGWICWNHSGDGLKVSPTDTNITLNPYWYLWDQGGNAKVCGRINWISGAGDANPSILVQPQINHYFGLRYLDGVSSSWHGRWNDGSGEQSGNTSIANRWTLWVCR